MNSLYAIEIKGLELLASIGILPIERAERQRIIISVRIESPVEIAMAAIGIEGLTNYAEVVGRIEARVASRHFDLVEELAREIMAIGFENPSVTLVEVAVEKPDIIAAVRSVGCRLRLDRDQWDLVG
ncbi:MAG: dihydroneopterin aldolase [Candidatus Pacebacteria bacterium]|nr:dihydroneopterin aldolase [Candidatus Paceibacterota bacterium]